MKQVKQAGWRSDFCPIGVLRSAGIPFSWLDELTYPDIAASIDAASDRRALALAASVLDDAHQVMRRIADRPLFRLASASAHPELYTFIVAPYIEGASGRVRKRGRIAAGLLQRFAAKNDTANGFGPVDRIDLQGTTPLFQPSVDPEQHARRIGLLSWWIVQQLAEAIAADPQCAPYIPYRLSSVVTLEQQRLTVGKRVVKLTSEGAALLEAVERGDTLEGTPLTPYLRAGLLRHDIQVPPTQPDPAQWLIRLLASWPGDAAERWRQSLVACQKRAQAISEAPPAARLELVRELEALISSLLQKPIESRGRGEFYVDKYVMYEEAQSASEPYELGGVLWERLQRALQPACALAATYGYARHLGARSWLYHRLGGKGASLLDVVTALEGYPADLREVEAGGTAGDLQNALLNLLKLNKDGVIDPADLEEMLLRFPQPKLSLVSPDVMLDLSAGGNPETARLILGELHGFLQVCGFLQLFWQDGQPEHWAAQTLGSQFDHLCQVVGPRTTGKTYPPELGCRSIEFEAAGLSSKHVRFGDVRLVWAGQQPLLRLPDGTSAEMLPLDANNPFYSVLSPHDARLPHLSMGTFTPEIRLGELLIQRACWQLTVPSSFPQDAAERFVEARRLRSRYALPERVFVRADGEPKPFYVDFRAPLLTDLFWHWIRGSRQLLITPLDPEPSGLWLRRGAERYCSEIRLSTILQSV